MYNNIKRKYKKRKRTETDNELVLEGELKDDKYCEGVIAFLKTFVAKTKSDKQTIYSRMEEIRINRIVWISQNHPSLTEIFDTYPKYLDNIELVSSKLLNFIVYKYYKYINIYF